MEITNYTRYSTEDLQRIVRVIETMSGFTAWRTDKIVFKEFDPKNPYITNRRSWGQQANEQKQKRYVSKMRWVDMGSISLLIPSKIYENPLEALVQDDTALAPVAMLVQIGNALLDRTNIGSYGSKLTGGDLPSLRVLERPETKKPKLDKDKVEGARKEYAKRNIRSFGWTTRRAMSELAKSHKNDIKAAGHHLREQKSRLDSINAAYADALVALSRLEAVINVAEVSI